MLVGTSPVPVEVGRNWESLMCQKPGQICSTLDLVGTSPLEVFKSTLNNEIKKPTTLQHLKNPSAYTYIRTYLIWVNIIAFN